ncbi:hypothetical protein AAHH67_23885 [Niallia circulans]
MIDSCKKGGISQNKKKSAKAARKSAKIRKNQPKQQGNQSK